MKVRALQKYASPVQSTRRQKLVCDRPGARDQASGKDVDVGRLFECERELLREIKWIVILLVVYGALSDVTACSSAKSGIFDRLSL